MIKYLLPLLLTISFPKNSLANFGISTNRLTTNRRKISVKIEINTYNSYSYIASNR